MSTVSVSTRKRNISEVDGSVDLKRPLQRIRSEVDENSKPCRLPFPDSTPNQTTAFQYPSQLISFSYTPHRILEFNNNALRYYVDPPRTADLSYAYDTWIKRPEERGRLDGLLTACLRKEVCPERQRANVISWRGVMTKILIAPYENRDTCELNVMRVGGTLYFEEHADDKKLAEKENMTPRNRLQSYFGYAFESYCTSASPDPRQDPEKLPNGWSGNINTNVQWCSIVKTKLGNNRLIIGGEVDCVNGRYTGQPDTFVELKTSMNIRGPQDEIRFEKKLLKFYFQSFLLGVPEIRIGFRTPPGRLTDLQTFKTVHIPRLVRGKPGAWDPNRCLHWGDQFLAFLRHSIANWSLPSPEPRPRASATTPVGPSSASSSSDRDSDAGAERKGRGDRADGSPPPGPKASDEVAAFLSRSQSDRQSLSERERVTEFSGAGGEDLNETRRRERCVWRVTFFPGKGAEVVLLDDVQVAEVRNGEERVGFLPTSFWNEVATSTAGKEGTKS